MRRALAARGCSANGRVRAAVDHDGISIGLIVPHTNNSISRHRAMIGPPASRRIRARRTEGDVPGMAPRRAALILMDSILRRGDPPRRRDATGGARADAAPTGPFAVAIASEALRLMVTSTRPDRRGDGANPARRRQVARGAADRAGAVAGAEEPGARGRVDRPAARRRRTAPIGPCDPVARATGRLAAS